MTKYEDWELCGIYVIDHCEDSESAEDKSTVMCIGINPEEALAVVAPFYADDYDSMPALHVEDGVDTFNMLMDYDNITRIPYIVKRSGAPVKWQIVAQPISGEEQ
jgi:hypothetical protein